MGEQVWWPRTQWLPSQSSQEPGEELLPEIHFMGSRCWQPHIKKFAFVAALFTDICRMVLSDAGLNVLRNLAKAVTLVHQVFVLGTLCLCSTPLPMRVWLSHLVF